MRYVTLCFVVLCVKIACAQESVQSAGDGASLLHGVRLNSEAMQKYDVLVEMSVAIDTPNRVEETVSYFRVAVDKGEKLCFLGIRAKKTVTQITGNASTAVTEQLAIHRVNDNSYSLRTFPGIAREGMASVGTFDEAMSAAKMPDFGHIGIWKFELPAKQRTNEEFWSSLAIQADKYGKTQSTSSGNTVLTTDSPINDDENVRFVSHINFDNKTLMPISRSVDVLINKNVRPYAREKVVWHDNGGVFVPLSVNLSDSKSRKNEEGKRTSYEVSTITKFKWMSVNAPIDKALLTGTDSVETLLRATNEKLFETP